MHPNEELLNRFYTAFARRDAETMASCYAPDAAFSDPVFTDLKGAEPPKMWRMLCGRAKDLSVSFKVVAADDRAGKAEWTATYSFSGTGRKVVNRVKSDFSFRDGKIVAQKDHFNLYAWARQALGVKGVLLGWLPPVQESIRKRAKAGLDAFKA